MKKQMLELHWGKREPESKETCHRPRDNAQKILILKLFTVLVLIIPLLGFCLK